MFSQVIGKKFEVYGTFIHQDEVLWEFFLTSLPQGINSYFIHIAMYSALF
jgi:hypothetical protein